MGQENEEHAELIATIRHDHVKMKTWYNSHANAKALHNSYGTTYPPFWRDVVNWNGWKETRKMFLKSIEGALSGGGGETTQTDGATTTSANVTAAATARKRRSRWATASTDDTAQTGDGSPPKRKSRWARGRDTTPAVKTNSVLDILPGLPSNLSSAQSAELSTLQATLRKCNAKISNLESEAARVDKLPIGHKDRSPSPPPVYGGDGKRKNTRAVRWRERYTTLRQDTLENILKLTTNGNAAQTVAPSLFNRKRTKKIYIPVEDHPTYNFIGLIIGPRGKTQKEMENKTGCKIAIRGKGSVKEGARGRRDGKVMEGDNEPLHVVITGDKQENVEAAGQMVTDMLVVIDDDKNVHKQQQLRELALLNGTLKEDEYCTLCAEKGHRAFECPKRFSMNKPGIEVRCAICGDTSHPTRDCKMEKKDAVTAEKEKKDLDSDYLAFMNELEGKPADALRTTNAAPRTSLVTTIVDGKPVGGPPSYDLNICLPAKKKEETSGTAAPVGLSSGGPLITTISSRVVKTPAPTPVPIITPAAATLPMTMSSEVGGNTTAPLTSIPTNVSAPPPIPPPPVGTAVGALGMQQVSAISPAIGSPPGTAPPQPPPPVPPPPPGAYGGYTQTHQQYGQQAAPYQPYQQQQRQYGYNGYQQGQQGGYQQQQHHYQQQGYNNRQQYDNGGQQGNGSYNNSNYYGGNSTNNNNNSSGNASNSGGFNWWDS